MPSGVEFDEDNMGFHRPAPGGGFSMNKGAQAPQSGMAGWLMRKGWVKSNNSAQFLLLGIVVVNAIIIFVLIKYFL